MFDEDLEALHGMLRRMDPKDKISINHHFICSTGELSWVVKEAMSARVQAKAAGTYEPFRSAFAD
jgi:hypothetical protein